MASIPALGQNTTVKLRASATSNFTANFKFLHRSGKVPPHPFPFRTLITDHSPRPGDISLRESDLISKCLHMKFVAKIFICFLSRITIAPELGAQHP